MRPRPGSAPAICIRIELARLNKPLDPVVLESKPPAASMMTEIHGSDFTVEAMSYVDLLEGELAHWAVAETADASVRRAIRAAHSLKGVASFVGADAIELRAHALEDLLLRFADTESDAAAPELLGRIRSGTAELRRALGEPGSLSSRAPDAGWQEEWLTAGQALIGLLQQGRRLAREYGKHVQVCLSGVQVLVEPAVVDAIRAPLGHVLRNAVAHAVEPPEVRARSGKPYFTTILIEVEEQLDELVVKVQDDGPGLDLAALQHSAARQGLRADESSTPIDAKDLAFLPGITTARSVDSLAGRGVGLEAARAAVELSGGTLELSTELGRYTTIIFRIPRRRCAVVEPSNAPRVNFGLVSDVE